MIRAASSTAPALPATFAHLPGQQQVPAAEHIERQIAVFVVVGVIEAALLHAVQRDVGIVEIEHDFARRPSCAFPAKEIDQQRIDLCSLVAINLLYFSLCRSGVCSTRLSVLLLAKASQFERSTGARLPGQRLEHWILAQLVVVVEVLIAQHQTKDPLPNLFRPDARHSERQPAAEALGKPTHQPERRDPPGPAAVHLRSDVMSPPSKPATPRADLPLQIRTACRTLCLHRGYPLDLINAFVNQLFLFLIRDPMHSLCRELG